MKNVSNHLEYNFIQNTLTREGRMAHRTAALKRNYTNIDRFAPTNLLLIVLKAILVEGSSVSNVWVEHTATQKRLYDI